MLGREPAGRIAGPTPVAAGVSRDPSGPPRRQNRHHRLKWAGPSPDLEVAAARALNPAADGGADRD